MDQHLGSSGVRHEIVELELSSSATDGQKELIRLLLESKRFDEAVEEAVALCLVSEMTTVEADELIRVLVVGGYQGPTAWAVGGVIKS